MLELVPNEVLPQGRDFKLSWGLLELPFPHVLLQEAACQEDSRNQTLMVRQPADISPSAASPEELAGTRRNQEIGRFW